MDSQGFIRHLSFLSGARALYKGTGATLLATSVMGFTSFGLNEFFRPCCSAVQQTSSERKSLCHAVMLRFTAGNRCELCNPWGHMRPSICFLKHFNTLSLSLTLSRRSLEKWSGDPFGEAGAPIVLAASISSVFVSAPEMHFHLVYCQTRHGTPFSLLLTFDQTLRHLLGLRMGGKKAQSEEDARMIKNDQECHAAETCLD